MSNETVNRSTIDALREVLESLTAAQRSQAEAIRALGELYKLKVTVCGNAPQSRQDARRGEDGAKVGS